MLMWKYHWIILPPKLHEVSASIMAHSVGLGVGFRELRLWGLFGRTITAEKIKGLASGGLRGLKCYSEP